MKRASARPIWFLRAGTIAVCGIGRPSGRRNSAVTANQSARPPTSAASAKARIAATYGDGLASQVVPTYTTAMTPSSAVANRRDAAQAAYEPGIRRAENGRPAVHPNTPAISSWIAEAARYGSAASRMGLPTTMWSAPERNASVGVTTRRWSSQLRRRPAGCRASRSAALSPNAARSGAASRPEAITPSQPAATAWRARCSASSSSVKPMPISARSAGATLVSTVTARILSSLALGLRGGLGDGAVAVDRQERRARACELPHGSRDRGRNVVELQVGEHFLVAADEPVEQLEVVP